MTAFSLRPPSRSARARLAGASVAGLVGLGATFWAPTAHAQLRWDVGGEVGVVQRIASDRPRGAPAPLPGPSGEVFTDVALLPMVRVGGYVSFDLSPFDGLPPLEGAEAGARLRLAPPVLPVPWRTWLIVGLGFERAYEPSHLSTSPEAPAPGLLPVRAPVAGAWGGVLDVPIAVALGFRANRVLEPFVELGARLGVAFGGPLYAPASSPYLGRDVVALSLSLGVNSNQ